MSDSRNSLPVISYTSPRYAMESFDALETYGAFILKDAVDISYSASTLLNTFDHFLRESIEVTEKYKGKAGTDDLPGLHVYADHWAGRRFSNAYGLVSDGEGNISQALPSDTFKDAAAGYIAGARDVVDKTLAAIDAGYHLDGKLINLFQGYSLLGIADIYTPPTQEKITDLIAKKTLTKTDDNRLEAFVPHEDLDSVTVIAYGDNDCTGLEMKLPDQSGGMSYQKITLPEAKQGELTPLVLLGKPMKIFTSDKMHSPEHRVVLEPLQPGQKFNRRLASAFTLFGADCRSLRSLVDDSSTYQISVEDYYKQEIQADEAKDALRAQCHFSEDEIARFPRESEIEVHRTDLSTTYQRR